MKKSWTLGLDSEQTKEMQREFVSSALLRERLEKLLTDKINENRKKQISNSTYDSPSWAYLQAATNGEENALRYVISLISSKEIEN